MTRYIGCDLGGTNLRAGLVDTETGEVSHLVIIPTQAREGHDVVMSRMAELFLRIIADSALPKNAIGGIGIGMPGVVDSEAGRTIFLPNLNGTWPNVPLAAEIRRQTGLPVSILNDVRAITYGEWRFGAGRGADTVAVFAIGTGVGGGLVINNRLHLGIGGTAGEFGHLTIDFNGPLCGCGNHGCVEAYASAPAIAAMGLKAVTQGLTTRIGELADYDLNRITPEVISRAAREGDPVARDIFEQAGFHLGIAIGNVLVTVSPRKVIIGGGLAKAGELLLGPIRRTLKERVRVAPVEHVEIVPAELGDNAGVIGVSCWAHERAR